MSVYMHDHCRLASTLSVVRELDHRNKKEEKEHTDASVWHHLLGDANMAVHVYQGPLIPPWTDGRRSRASEV